VWKLDTDHQCWQHYKHCSRSLVPSSFTPRPKALASRQIFTGVIDEIDHKIISDFNPPSTIDRNSL